jgi:hypothetical protein
MLHSSLFASKWIQALHFSLGDSFASDRALALLYVMYNPVSRRDIAKKSKLANNLLAELLRPLHVKYTGKSKPLVFYIKAAWLMLKFSFTNRELADCNPTLVVEASQEPHAAIFKHISRILMLVKLHKRDAKADWKTAKTKILGRLRLANALGGSKLQSIVGPQQDTAIIDVHTANTSLSWIRNLRNCWNRTNRIAPAPADQEQFDNDAPRMFVDQFAFKRQFLAENIEEEARLSILTLLIFPQEDDFGSSNDCKRHKKMMSDLMAAFQKSFRALFRVSKELGSMDSTKKIASLPRSDRVFQKLVDLVFGEEMNLLRNFHWLTDEEAFDLFQRHEFPELQASDCDVSSVDKNLKRLLAADHHESHEVPNEANQSISSMVHLYSEACTSITSSFESLSHDARANLHDDAIAVQPPSTAPFPAGSSRVRPVMFSSKAGHLAAGVKADSVAAGIELCSTLLSSVSSKDRSNVNAAYTDQTKSSHSSLHVAKSAAAAAGSIAAVSLVSEIAPGISKSHANIHISLSNRRVDDGSGKAIGINAESNSALRRQSVEGLSSAHSDGRIKDAKFVPVDELQSEIENLAAKLSAAEERIKLLEAALIAATEGANSQEKDRASQHDALDMELRIANAGIVAAFLRADAAETLVKELKAELAAQSEER